MEAQVKIAKQRKRRGEVLTDSGRKRKKDESNKRTFFLDWIRVLRHQ